MREKLQEYALIAEIVSAVAVVASLIFVGLGVRQNSEQMANNAEIQQLSAYQELVSNIIRANELLATDDALAGLDTKAIEDPSSLTDPERRKYDAFYRVYMRHATLAYIQYERGLIDEEMLYNALIPFRARLQYSLSRELWESSKNSDALPKGFAAYMNDMLENVSSD